MMFVLNCSVEYLSYYTQYVYSGYYYACAGYYGYCAVEQVGLLKGADEDCHLCYEAAESRQSQVGKAGYYVAYRQKGHYFHQSAKLAYVAGVCAAVYHAYEGEEKCCHQSV